MGSSVNAVSRLYYGEDAPPTTEAEGGLLVKENGIVRGVVIPNAGHAGIHETSRAQRAKIMEYMAEVWNGPKLTG